MTTAGVPDVPTMLCKTRRMVRTRRIVASILAVVTAILLLLTTLGWWADRYFLDSERFASTADKIVDQEDVQHALSVAITDQISDAAGTDLQIAQPFISSIVTGVVQSDQFQSLFEAAVLRLHRAVVGGGAREAVLDLTTVVDRVRNAIEPIAPDLADNIPEGEKLRVQILDKSQLDTVYDSVNLVKDLVLLLTILTIVSFAAAIALSPRRWRTLALTGWVVFGLFLVRLIAQRIGRGVVSGFAERDEYRAAAESTYKVVLNGLTVQTIVVIVIALIVALFAGWTDRHGGWAAVTASVRRGAEWTKQQLPKKAPAPTPALATAGVGSLAGDAPAPVGAPNASAAPETGTRAVVEGVLAPRLPEPKGPPRAAHWWRAAGLLVIGLYAVFSPGSLTTFVVVALGIAALYLAITEGIAAWGSPREPKTPDDEPTTADAPATDADADAADAATT